MKHTLLLLGCICCGLVARAQNSGVSAPPSITFMNKQFFFSHWEILENRKPRDKKEAEYWGVQINEYIQPHITVKTATLTLPKNKQFYVDYRGAAHITAYYYPKGETQKSHSEQVHFETEGHPNPYEYNLKVAELNRRRRAATVPFYVCGDSTDAVTMLSLPTSFSVSKMTQYGTFGWTQQHAYNSKGDKPQQFYRDYMCAQQYPEWLQQPPRLNYARKESDSGTKPTQQKPGVAPKTGSVNQLKKVQTINYRAK